MSAMYGLRLTPPKSHYNSPFGWRGGSFIALAVILAAWILASCAHLAPVVDRLAKEEADCKAKGGAFVLDKGCVMPTPPPAPTPAPEPVPSPEPAPQPGPVPEPPAPPGGGISIDPGEYYELPVDGPATAGSLEFTITGLDGSAFPQADGWLLAIMGRTAAGAEQNLQVHIYNDGGRNAQMRLIAQRHDGSCAPKRFCERTGMAGDMDIRPDQAYQVKLWWDQSTARMTMTGGGSSWEWETSTFGGFASFEWIRLGAAFPKRGGPGGRIVIHNYKRT